MSEIGSQRRSAVRIGMTEAEAREIAIEHIRWWASRTSPQQAWIALGMPPASVGEWHLVLAAMVRIQLGGSPAAGRRLAA